MHPLPPALCSFAKSVQLGMLLAELPLPPLPPVKQEKLCDGQVDGWMIIQISALALGKLIKFISLDLSLETVKRKNNNKIIGLK